MTFTPSQREEIDEILKGLNQNICVVTVYDNNSNKTNEMLFQTPWEALVKIQEEDLELLDVNARFAMLTVKPPSNSIFHIFFKESIMSEKFALNNQDTTDKK